MTPEQSLRLFKQMLRIRRMEELCAELYSQEKIRGFLHLYIGEEAVATGVIDQLSIEDNVIATYREHGHALLKGVSSRAIMAEMFGKKDGCSKGYGGSMHLFSLPHRFFGGNAIVAGGIPQSVGLAFASKILNQKRLTVCFFGEGAMAEGVFHESMNLAVLWKIPLLFCCENNLYAMGTALSRSQSQIDLVKKAQSYNMASHDVDGMDIYDVVEKTKQAIQYIQNEKKPFFLEFKTYRFRAHSMFDPELYRTKVEVEAWKKRDPIASFRKDLMSKKILTTPVEKQILQDIEIEFEDAIHFAEVSPLTPIEEIEKDTYTPFHEGTT